MKRLFFLFTILALASTAISAQPGYGPGSRYGDNRRYGSYSQNSPYGREPGRRYGYGYETSWYAGVKFGMVASSVHSESSALDGNRIKTGISLGAAVGMPLAPMASFESGLYYVEKGGSSVDDNTRFTYQLNYLELPLILKYNYISPSNVVFQPYVGCYLGLGISGDIKDYKQREAFSSYSNGYFRHGDSGIKIGCGVAYSFLYAEIGYDFGLSNIGQDTFDDTRNGALRLSVGFAF